MQKVTILIPTVPARKERLSLCISKLIENTSYRPLEIKVMVDDGKDWVWNIRHMANEVKEGLVVYFADDIEVEKDWLTIAMKKYNESFPDGEGLLAFNDGIQFGKWATHGITTPKFLLKYFYTGYKHFYVDLEISRVAMTLGKYVYCEESKATHIHPCVGKHKIDETYKANYDGPLPLDRELFEKRKKMSDDFKNLDKVEWSD